MNKEYGDQRRTPIDSELIVEEVQQLMELQQKRSQLGEHDYTVVIDAQIQSVEARIASMRSPLSGTVFEY